MHAAHSKYCPKHKISMKKIIRKAIPVCIYICIGMCIPLILASTKLSDKELPESKVAALAVVPAVPDEVRFADEMIKLDRADLRERRKLRQPSHSNGSYRKQHEAPVLQSA